ncbi:unnamed protein product [Adineta steineri]|uniref:Uncharacterized protein n=1 Tax=Adineta steineri TaxID=433720 RepID=A0A818HVF4_9BILA|nr:unnamed protein product [Adineta steineri]
MKLKDYLNSLVSRRKSNTSSKSPKTKINEESISSTDYHYEICDYNDTNKVPINDQPNRTEFLLARHAHLVNTIVGIQSQANSCSHCRILHQQTQPNFFSNPNYSNTLATCNLHSECPYQTFISSSNSSLCVKTRQRSKIRTNPWIKTTQTSQAKNFVCNPSTLSSGLIHSESFPQTIANGNIYLENPLNRILHQSDSGHGLSLSSSRMIDSSSSPDNTSNDGILSDNKQFVLYTKQIEQYSSPKTIPSDNKRKIKKSSQSRYQRPSNSRLSSPKKNYIHRKNSSRSSSPRLHNDHFSVEFEEIVENERIHKQRSPTRKSPFILPLDETYVQSSSSPLSILRSTTLKKSNSRTILRHIEEIENEIQMITNLNLDQDEQMIPSNTYSKENNRQSIHEQVDQWIEQCLTTTNKDSTTLLHTQCDQLLNRIDDSMASVCSNNDQPKALSLPKSSKQTELMTEFYLSATPSTKRTHSFTYNPLEQLSKSQTITNGIKSTHECPF